VSSHIGLRMIASTTRVVLPVAEAALGMLGQLEPRGDPCDGRETPGADVPDDMIYGEQVLLPSLRMLAVAADRGVGRPDGTTR
jgi:hypothetical protein